MNVATAQVLEVIFHALEHDYQKYFSELFEIAARVKKKMPLKPADELRNGFDHFSKAILRAAAFDSKANKKRPKSNLTRSRISVHRALLDAWRGKRHIIAGQYHSIYFSTVWRTNEIRVLLESSSNKNSLDSNRYKKRLEAIEAKWEKIPAPSKRRFHSVAKLRAVIRRTEKLIIDLSLIADSIDQLRSELPRLPAGTVRM